MGLQAPLASEFFVILSPELPACCSPVLGQADATPFHRIGIGCGGEVGGDC